MKVQMTATGWILGDYDPPVRVSFDRARTRADLDAFIKTEAFASFAAARVTDIAERAAAPVIHRRVAFQEDMPGTPENPDAPKADESMESFTSKVMSAIDAKGWTGYSTVDPVYDFYVVETYTDAVIVRDMKSNKMFKVGVTVTDGAVTLADPVEYEVTYQEVDNPESTMAAGASGKRVQFAATAIGKTTDEKKRAVFELVLCQSGWTVEKERGAELPRYVLPELILGAVKNKLWDGAKMNVLHPDEDTGTRPSPFACGIVRPGSVRVEQMGDGVNVQAVGAAVLFNTPDGKLVEEALDASLEFGVPIMGTSTFSNRAVTSEQIIDGQRALVFSSVASIDGQDFVEDPAFAGAVARRRLAAAASVRHHHNEDGGLSVTEKERLEQLEREAREKDARIARFEREKKVDQELKDSGLPESVTEHLRPLLCEVESDALRASQIAKEKATFFESAKRNDPPNGGTAALDDATITSNPDAGLKLTDEQRVALNAYDRTHKLTPEGLASARKKVMALATN